MKLSRLGSLVAASVLVVGACSGSSATTAPAASAPAASTGSGGNYNTGINGAGCTVGVSWNNFQQPRWAAHDKPNIEKTVEAAGGTYIDADATVAAILAVGAVTLARASGDTRLSDWLLRCADRAIRPLLKPRASPAKKRSRSRRKAAGARRAKPAARSRGGRAAAGPKARSSAASR